MMSAMDPLPPEALLDAYPPPIRALADELRMILRGAVPDAIERVRPGWRLLGYDLPVAAPSRSRPTGRCGGRTPRPRTTYFAWIAPEPGHVHLGFEHGMLLADPGGILSGRGITKRVRWFTFRPGDRPDGKLIRAFLASAVSIARADPADRRAQLAFAAEAAPFPDRGRSVDPSD
jgi:hypothetical protein